MNLIASAEKSWKTSWTVHALHRPVSMPSHFAIIWHGRRKMQLPHPGMCPTGFIVICQDLNLGASIPRYQKDVGIVAQTMLLAAAEKGLGGCMIGNYNADSVKKELNLADNLAPVLIVAFGKPAEKIVIKEINEGEDIAYYRDENDVHYVPKRKLADIILKK